MKKRMVLSGFALALFFAVLHARGLYQETPKPLSLQEHQAETLRRPGERSPAWPALAKRFRAANPTCAACGSMQKVQVHHVRPFGLDPALELDEGNLLSLCRQCHRLIGHGGAFKFWNPNAREDAAKALANPELYDQVVKRAKDNRLRIEQRNTME